jgi:hypothetical protein
MELNPYASYLNGQDPIPVLTSTAKRLQTLTARLTGAQINTPPAPRKWSICNIVAHLADCEIVFAFRLRQTLAEDHHTVQPFDQDKWAANYATIDANEALATFSLLRRWNLLLIGSALPKHAAKPVTHPERGAMTFATIVETMAGHDLNHVLQLERIADAK